MMKYQVTYRLMHPEYLPTTSVTVVDAHNHRELETKLVKVMAKWQAQGYTIQVINVSQGKLRKHHFTPVKKNMM